MEMTKDSWLRFYGSGHRIQGFVLRVFVSGVSVGNLLWNVSSKPAEGLSRDLLVVPCVLLVGLQRRKAYGVLQFPDAVYSGESLVCVLRDGCTV